MAALLALAGASGSNSNERVSLSSALEDTLSKNEDTKKVKKIRRKNRPVKGKKTTENASLDECDFVCGDKKAKKKKDDYYISRKKVVYDCHNLSSTLRIQPVCKDAACTFLRKRNTRFKYIRLHKFIESGATPVVFTTKLKTQKVHNDSLTNVQKSLAELNLSAAKAGETRKKRGFATRPAPVEMREKAPPKKTKRKSVLDKKSLPMKGYMLKGDVDEGLRTGALVKGVIRINPRNSREAYVSNEDRSVHDYVITSMPDRNGALEGDEVVLQVNPEAEWKEGKATAAVVFILRKVHSRLAIGHLKLMPDRNRFFAQLIPRDPRIPRIRVPQISWPQNFYKASQQYENVLFLVQIVSWDDARYAIGMIKETLGTSGDLKVETEVILKEHSLDVTPYTVEETNVCLKHFDDVSEVEMKLREDLREECIFTIDPASARDLDDAVSCKQLPNGNFKVGVHISDVSYYLDEQTVLDEKASQKATTIYLVNSTYHMLPLELCMECSLLPASEKRTFSVFWEMTPDGDVLDTHFTRSLIKSCTKLAYEHAQMMIDRPDCECDEMPDVFGFSPRDVSAVVNQLNGLARCLRERRFKNGALRIDQPKLMFKLNGVSGEPEEWSIYELKEAHRMIEEFMLLANMSVAARIKEQFPDLAFLRCHEPPIQHMLQETQNSLEMAGIFIDTSSSGSLQSTLWKYYGDDYLSVARMAVLNHLFAKPMKRAIYFCAGNAPCEQNYHHYALHVPLYTHFTSPIRRYADVMVHRLLAACLGYKEKPNWSTEYVAQIAENCNVQKYNAKKAGDASTDLYLAHYIEAHQPFIQSAVVVDVREKAFEVIVLKTGSVVRLNVNDFDEGVKWKAISVSDKSESSPENGKKLSWKMEVTFPPLQCTTQSITIVIERFAVVKVALNRKEKTNKLEAKLVAPIPTISFSSNGESSFLYADDEDVSDSESV